MKSSVLATALVAGMLLGTAKGSPLYTRRTIVKEVVYVTKTVVDAVVYVDENGKLLLTPAVETTYAIPTSVPAFSQSLELAYPEDTGRPTPHVFTSKALAVAAALSVSVGPSASAIEPPLVKVVTIQSKKIADQTSSSVPLPSTPKPVTVQQPASSTQLAQASKATFTASNYVTEQSESNNGSSLGITYDMFTGNQTSARCKTEQEITSDFENMTDYSIVRIYGMGCNIIPIAMQNVIKNNQQLMGGAYLNGGSDGENLTLVIETLHDAVNQYASGSWDVVPLFSVENEQVNNHAMTAASVVDAINSARSQLQALGFNGLVGAVETVPAIIDNPSICEASDVAMVNCHAFFDSNTVAQDAGTFVKSQVARVQTACNSRRVIVTESGWPHDGDANGKAVPSPENQQLAIESLRENFDHDLFIHNSFDSTWKSDGPSTFNAERYWGIIQ